MIKDEDSIEKIITARDRYPINLTELIQYAMTYSGPATTINYVALNTINILILNLDIYLYLENKFNLEENLIKLQNECMIEGTNTLIVDECSSLRQEILNHIKSMALARHSNGETVVKKSSSSIYRKQINELHRFLKETKHNLHDNHWIANIRKSHKLSLDEVIKVGLYLFTLRE